MMNKRDIIFSKSSSNFMRNNDKSYSLFIHYKNFKCLCRVYMYMQSKRIRPPIVKEIHNKN